MRTELELIPGTINRRLGRVRGDDGLERIVRSFHFRIRSVKCGDKRATARTRVAYVLREGEYKKDAEDVEASAGDRDRLLDAADRIEATSRIKTGPTAERILQSFVQELPAESTPGQRQAAADAIVEHWRDRYGEDRPGHEAIAVVHVHGEENPQAHLHVEVAARPILPDGDVDRSVRLWGDRASCGAAFRAEREAMADLVNRACDPEVPFHAGTFKEMGREDEGKPRLPISRYRKMRAEIAEASTAEEEEEIERRCYALEAKRREDLHAAGTKRSAEIAELKERGEWKDGKPIGARERLARRSDKAEGERDEVRKELAAEREKRIEAEAESDTTKQALEAERRAREAAQAERDSETGRADELHAFSTELVGRVTVAEGQVRELTAKQTAYLADVHRKAGRELPDLETERGQGQAWEFLREVTENGLAVSRAKTEEEERRRAQKREEARKAGEAARAKEEREEAGRRALDALRSHWTRERQAREKYAERRRSLLDASWTGKDQMIRGFRQDYDLEDGMIRMVDGKGRNATGEELRWRAEAVAVHDMLYEAAGKAGVDFGHGIALPAWRTDLDLFLDHGRTVAQDENGDRTRVAFPRVAGAPELVLDREQGRWDYRHPDAGQSYWMKAGDAPDWESAAGIAHYASVRDALKRGEKVPEKAAADYPDLVPKPAPVKERPAPPRPRRKPPPSRGGGGLGD